MWVWLLVCLTVPEIWRAGRQMDTLQLQVYHREALQQMHPDPMGPGRWLVVLVDLYRMQVALAHGQPQRAQEALREALNLLESVPKDQRTADHWAFLGNFYGTQLAFTPWYRRPVLGRRATQALHRALHQDSLNPRAWLFAGLQAFYTPRLFGGGPQRAVERLNRALELYRRRDPFWDRWGEDLALLYRARALMQLGHQEEARRTLQMCLQRYPDSAEALAWNRRIQEASLTPSQREVTP